MSAIGPELPPHLLAKRKRREDDDSADAPATASGANDISSPDGAEKRRRVIGPAMPPAPLDERPDEELEQAEESDSDNEDGFGPALPPDGTVDNDSAANNEGDGAYLDPVPSEQKLKRDDWMTMPPKQDDLAARMDTLKQKPRGFNTGKGARSANSLDDDGSTWHETPEQKQKRLADEMMGVSKPASSTTGPQRPNNHSPSDRDGAVAQNIRQHAEKTRGPSLMDRHSERNKGTELDDDPSKRAFDREKDMGSGMRVGHAQRSEMLKKASDFSSKFSGGSYL